MYFAVNYSPLLAELVKKGQVNIEYFKCPAWEQVVYKAADILPTYVHFPLVVGGTQGDIIDTDQQAPVDWSRVDTLLARSDTPYLNLHLLPRQADYPHFAAYTSDPFHIEAVLENTLQGIEQAVRRFGAERIILENDHDSRGTTLQMGYQPHFLRTIVEETGCGFLLDLSHARFAAEHLQMPIVDYLRQLPLDAIREVHITGIQPFDATWAERAKLFGVDMATIAQVEGMVIDHLPMTAEDFEFFAACLGQIRDGVWAEPWVVGYEYGGVTGLWEATTDEAIYQEQLPQLMTMIQQHMPISSLF